ISGLAGRLWASGFLQGVGAGARTGGRPRILLKLNPHAGFVVGLKLTERSIICALADLEANVLHDRLTPVQSMQDPQAAITAISRAIEEVLNVVDLPHAKIMGIGIGLAGIIDSYTGVCDYSPILKWRQ